MRKITGYQIITIAASLMTFVVNALANSLPINGQGTGEISDKFDIYFVPAGYVFTIWGLIYLGLLGFTIFQALPSQRENLLIRKISPAYWIGSAANTAWIFLWHYEVFSLTLPLMVTILVSLLVIYRGISTSKADLDGLQRFLVKYPFSIYLGWISVATIANVSQVLFFYNWGGWGISAEIWAVAMLIIALILGILMNWLETDTLYGLVLVWAFAGIGISQADTVVVANTAWVAAGALGLSLIISPLVSWFRSKAGEE
jgi:hypothetical protein